MDQTYLGLTAIGNPISPRKSDWVRRARVDGRQLRVRSVPYGNHRFRLKGIPDFDFGPQQSHLLLLSIQQEEMILFVDILRQKVTDGKGKTYAVGRPNDPFQELEDDHFGAVRLELWPGLHEKKRGDVPNGMVRTSVHLEGELYCFYPAF